MTSSTLTYESTEKGTMYVGGIREGENLIDLKLEPVNRDTIVVDRNWFLEHITEIKAWALKRLVENPYES